MTQELVTANAAAIVDGFDLDRRDPTASPIRGTSYRFKDGGYFSFAERVEVKGRQYLVLDKQSGWQKLAKDQPPEFLIQKPGEPRPSRPQVDEKDWPTNFNNEPEHPWRWTSYLTLLDAKTGEIATFSTNTVGGRIAIDQLADQVGLMRAAQPGATPLVALESKDMPTSFGGAKPRPHFAIKGWRRRGGGEELPALTSPKQQFAKAKAPTTKEIFNDEIGI